MSERRRKCLREFCFTLRLFYLILVYFRECTIELSKKSKVPNNREMSNVPNDRGRQAYCYQLGTNSDSLTVTEKLLMQKPNNTFLDPGIEPRASRSAIVLAATRPTRQLTRNTGCSIRNYMLMVHKIKVHL